MKEATYEQKDQLYHKYLEIESLSEFDDKTALNMLGNLIDCSYFLNKPEGLSHAIDFSDELLKRNLSDENRSELHYFIANLWSDFELFKNENTEDQWIWDQQETAKRIINIRYSYKYGFLNEKVKITNIRKCEILTNYGNALSNVGRVVEAIEYYDKVLNIEPNFSMAKGTRGSGLFEYAKMLYDGGHQEIFLNFAYQDLKEATKGRIYPQARDYFQTIIEQIENVCPKELLTNEYDLISFELGKSEKEIEYRKWALENRLFLNPLNDLGIYPIAANDVLMTPSITTKNNEGPHYQGFHNQIKQEFVSARYLYYEGLNQKEVHFSDIGVKLSDTGDFPSYGLSIEKIKLAYRMAYSIFDKIAVFINYYLKLGLDPSRVTFRNIWDQKRNKKEFIENGVEFYDKKNLPLKGLFWLSKDFTYKDFKDSIEPESEELKKIRDSLEHKYLKIHSDIFWIDQECLYNIYGKDSLAHSICYSDLVAKTLKILKLARSAIMYLSFAIHTEERERDSMKKDRNGVIPIQLEVINDNDKKIDYHLGFGD